MEKLKNKNYKLVNKYLIRKISMPEKESFYPMLFAVFGFMMIIATGVDFLIGSENIPIIVSIIGLILILIAMYLRNREKIKQ